MVPRTWHRVVPSALVVALGGALNGCSSDDQPARGQLMLVLGTDMAVPKDIDNIRVQVVRGSGTLVHDQTYWIESGDDGDTKLPATLAVVAGEAGNDPVQVRLIAARRNQARVFSKVKTTLPRDRIALLPLPVQWLCDGSVTEIADDTYESACASKGDQEYSCVAGTCEPVDVDVDDLADFEPERVFGGGAGPGDALGRCFAAEACFDGGEAVEPISGCRLELEVPNGGEINVALTFPLTDADGNDGPGLCGEEGCYVPLDRDERFGWQLEDDGSVKLPAAVCELLDAGRISQLRACYTQESKTLQFPSCAPWSSVGGG